MPRTRVVIYRDLLQRVSQVPAVRAALQSRANTIAARARQLDPDAAITVVSGIRPLGRAYSNVVSDNVDGEFGSSKTHRRRALGRAADIQE